MARKRRVNTGAGKGQGRVLRRVAAKRLRGHTLYEILFVVAVLALVGAIMTPTSKPAERARMELAAAEVAGAFRFARSEAIRRGQPVGVHRDVTNARFRLFSLDFGTDPATVVYDVYHPVDKHLYERRLLEAPFNFDGKMIETPEFRGACDSVDQIYFDATGTAWCADPDNILLDGLKIGLTYGTTLTTVSVQPISGRVVVQ